MSIHSELHRQSMLSFLVSRIDKTMNATAVVAKYNTIKVINVDRAQIPLPMKTSLLSAVSMAPATDPRTRQRILKIQAYAGAKHRKR